MADATEPQKRDWGPGKPLPEARRRTRHVLMRLTAQEAAVLERRARATGTTISGAARALIREGLGL